MLVWWHVSLSVWCNHSYTAASRILGPENHWILNSRRQGNPHLELVEDLLVGLVWERSCPLVKQLPESTSKYVPEMVRSFFRLISQWNWKLNGLGNLSRKILGALKTCSTTFKSYGCEWCFCIEFGDRVYKFTPKMSKFIAHKICEWSMNTLFIQCLHTLNAYDNNLTSES